mgnify:CR=1 FL=1
MTDTWKQAENAATDTWKKPIGDGTHCYATQYAGSDDYNWQTWRNGYCISGIVTGRDSAMAKADEMLARPIEEFNAIVAAGLRADMKDIEKKLLIMQPDTTLLPGYHAGYEAGMEGMKRKIEAVLS